VRHIFRQKKYFGKDKQLKCLYVVTQSRLCITETIPIIPIYSKPIPTWNRHNRLCQINNCTAQSPKNKLVTAKDTNVTIYITGALTNYAVKFPSSFYKGGPGIFEVC